MPGGHDVRAGRATACERALVAAVAGDQSLDDREPPVGARRDLGRRRNAGRLRDAARLARSPCPGSRDRTSPSTTTSTESTVPTPNSSSSSEKPCFAAKRSGRSRTPVRPVSSASTGSAASSEQRRRTAAASTGARMTQRDDARPDASLRARARLDPPPEPGDAERVDAVAEEREHRRQSVSAASTETMPTRIAPAARLRRIVSGTSTIPTIASTNADAAEEHGAARRRADRRDRVELLAAEPRAPRGSGRRRRASSRSRARGPSPRSC